MGPEAFLEPLGYDPAPGPIYRKALCHTRLVGGVFDKYPYIYIRGNKNFNLCTLFTLQMADHMTDTWSSVLLFQVSEIHHKEQPKIGLLKLMRNF